MVVSFFVRVKTEWMVQQVLQAHQEILPQYVLLEYHYMSYYIPVEPYGVTTPYTRPPNQNPDWFLRQSNCLFGVIVQVRVVFRESVVAD